MNMSNKSKIIDKYSTYLLVIVAFAVSQILVATGAASHKFEGLLIPISVYILLAMSLNLVVGISGELSLGHAGFMCIGAYTGSLFSMVMVNNTAIPSHVIFPFSILIGGTIAALFGF